jgi:phosphoribosyl 1,2-cyclic phosphodiesterase
LRFCLLASGSKGNCVWVEEDGRAIIVDNGLSFVELKKRAQSAGINLASVRDVIISHEHTDHVQGVGPAARKLGLTVHVSQPTAEAAGAHLKNLAIRHFEPGQTLDFGFLKVKTITGSHDCADPSVFVVEGGRHRLGLATDLGVATALVRQEFSGLSALILEFNHDLQMLLSGPYPYFLKQRVRSRKGHLSNEQAAELLHELQHHNLQQVVLAHLSEVNNTPALALAAALASFGQSPPPVAAASQWEPTEVFTL